MEEQNRGKGRIGKLIFTVVSSAAVTVLVLYGLCYYMGWTLVSRTEYEAQARSYEENEKFLEIQRLLDETYLGEIDRETMLDDAYHAMVSALGDPYTRYLDKEEMAALSAAVNNQFTGIGVIIQGSEEGLLVLEVIPDGPAMEAGIQVGDIIVSVEGTKYTDATEAAGIIKGKAGTTVKLVYRRGGVDTELSVVRGEVISPSVTWSVQADGTGYLRIKSFAETTSEEVKSALEELEKANVKGVVIDLRNNPGGLFDQGIQVADLLLPECTITYTTDRQGTRTDYDSDSQHASLPYVLLVNENTASAAEILTAAVQDNGGTVVGTQTYGKGVVQRSITFQDGTGINITWLEYFSPTGTKIHGVGIAPDVTASDDAATEEDEALQAAVKQLG